MSNKIIASSKSANDTRGGEPLSTTRAATTGSARQVQPLHECRRAHSDQLRNRL